MLIGQVVIRVDEEEQRSVCLFRSFIVMLRLSSAWETCIETYICRYT